LPQVVRLGRLSALVINDMDAGLPDEGPVVRHSMRKEEPPLSVSPQIQRAV